MRRANVPERHDFSRTVFPDDWAESQRDDVDPEAVCDHPPFCHRFVGAWPNIRCVPIQNNDEYLSLSSRNVQAEGGRGRGFILLSMRQEARERKEAADRAFQLEEAAKDREYHRRYGRSFVNIEPNPYAIPTPRQVTISDKDERFADIEAEKGVEDIVLQSLMPEPFFVPSGDELDNESLLAAAGQLETNKRKWEVDEDVPSYPSTDYCEEIVWKPAPSRILLDPEREFIKQPSRLPLTDSCREKDFSRFDLFYESFCGLNIALLESDSDNEFCTGHNLDDRHASALSTYDDDNAQ